MASPAQNIANQANAQHSTGPRTPEGKARVAQNAVRHGLTAKHLVIRPDDQAEFDQFQADLAAELDPQGTVEALTFHELLHAAWNLQRFRRIEAELSTGDASDFFEAPNAAALDRLSRYQTRTQRAYYKALAELRKLQTNRALRSQKLEDPADREVPVITDINNLTKQTHSEVMDEALKQAFRICDLETGLLLQRVRKQRGGETEPAAQRASEKASEIAREEPAEPKAA
jgi:hypothetical protein